MYSGDSSKVKELIAKALPGTMIEVKVEDIGAYIRERVNECLAMGKTNCID